MKIINDFEQNTDAWIAYKVGKFSASSADKLLMDEKTKGYQGLIDQIIEERITGLPAEGRWGGNQYTERGHEFEEKAALHFESEKFIPVESVGVIERDDWTLCSPDRLIDNDGLLQIKCPIFKTQREYLKQKKVPGNYFKQMQFELWVSERDYNIFYSYHPFLPPLEIKVERDKKIISQIEQKLKIAKEQVLKEIEFVNSLKL